MATSEPRAAKSRERRGTAAKTTLTAIQRRERDRKAVQLRAAGAGWQAIADQLEYSSPGHAHDRFMAFMKEYPREDVETLRDIEADRYERLQASLWRRAINPEDKQHMWAVDRVLRIMDQRARLLGLNLPSAPRVDAEGTASATSMIEGILAALRTQQQ